jgi:hypothetical protein
VDHLESKEAFSREEIQAVTDWKGDTPGTYWSKQFKPFVVDAGNGKFRVSEAFRPYRTWEKFLDHVTQVRRIASSDYNELSYRYVRVYEFFMPLTNEAFLRTTLDALFYRDTIEASLRTIDPETLHKEFPQHETENDTAYSARLCEWLSNHFVGYSIYHVNGRFRAQPLAPRLDAAQMHRYLVDETTAVARFIFPCQDEEDARLTAFFFKSLFVQAIVEVVNGEDEIWMTETGMENRLHIWRVDTSGNE